MIVKGDYSKCINTRTSTYRRWIDNINDPLDNMAYNWIISGRSCNFGGLWGVPFSHHLLKSYKR